MSLIPCPECQKEISDKAPACPHCGNPMTPPEKTYQPGKVEQVARETLSQTLFFVIGLAAVLVVVMLIFLVCDKSP